MADDDNTSIFAKAGFDLPKAASMPAAPVAAADGASTPSIFESAGFKLPDKTSHADALESQTAQGAQGSQGSSPAPKQGRGIWQAIKDYPAHVANSLVDTVKLPGTIMTANPYPQGTESWYDFENSREKAINSGGPQLAGLISGGEFPRVGLATAAQKIAPATQAVNRMVEAVGPENVPTAIARMNQNPRLTLADVSDPVRTMTQGLIDPAQPKAQNLIAQAVKERAGSRLEAANTAFTEAMGPTPDVIKMVDGLKERARAAGREAIQPALTSAKPVDVSPVVAAIDQKLQPGVNPLLDPGSKLPLSAEQEALARMKQQLTAPTGETLFDAQRLHEVQSNIGDQAYQLMKSPDPKDRLLGGQLRTMNEKLIDQIDDASGGAYRPARAKFKDAKDISEAFESGFDTLKNRSGMAGALEDSPQAFREWMKDATPEEVVARRLGTRADIDQKINSVKNGALKGETITSIPYNQDKLRALFGDNEANRLIRVMKDSQDQALTDAKLVAGAKTAETQAGQRATAIPKVDPFQLGSLTQTMLPGTLAEIAGQYAGAPTGLTAATLVASGLAAGAIKKGVQSVQASNALSRNVEFARRALATGPARRDTINALLSHPKVVRELKKSDNALTTQ